MPPATTRPNTVTLSNLAAPAKLNLFLHVIGRREDGRHLLQSLFVLIDLADTIDISLRLDGNIERTGDIIGDVEKDLCVRAARALQTATNTSKGANIHVTKNIPSGAGMGGGSSDAATTLIALNRLWNLNLTRDNLMQIGLTLGADVPFFIFGQSAFAQGIGEKLAPIEVPNSYWTILMPNDPTSTAEIFAADDLTRNSKSLKISVFSAQLRSEWPNLVGHNDLQPVASRLNPQIDRALKALGSGARMTGSGSAVFAWADSADSANHAARNCPQDMQAYVAQTLAKHPLYTWVPNAVK